MKRFHQTLLVGSLLPLCWLLMMVVHELGHVLGATVTGGTVSKVVLHPLTISRTDLAVNPHPLWVVWAGPVIGVLLPVSVYAAVKAVRLRWSYLVQFFAGFCLIANGAYIGAGSIDGIGDCGQMLELGTPAWCLWLFGLVAVTAGLYFWHGLGREFGLGEDAVEPDWRAACVMSGLLVITVALELALSSK